MAYLTTEERIDVWTRHMEYQSEMFATYGNFSKQELLVFVGEIDDWIEQGSPGQVKNIGSDPCKTELTLIQKEDIEIWVTRKRMGEI